MSKVAKIRGMGYYLGKSLGGGLAFSYLYPCEQFLNI